MSGDVPILRTNTKDMQIGDIISCEYTASSGIVGSFANLGNAIKAEIPVGGSATPNGSFYFIHTGYDSQGRMKLVADRNIQHSISWDILNNNGVIDGVELFFNSPFLSNSNIGLDYSVSASSIYSSGYDAWKAFDGSLSGDSRWVTGPGTTGWLKIEYATSRKLLKYLIYNNYDIQTMPKDWTFEGSSDDTNWVILDIQSNITTWPNNVREFIINNSNAYKYYRINITANNGGTGSYGYVNIGELRLVCEGDEIRYPKYFIRSLSGGVNSDNKSNEWDKILCEADLNGTITPGDDNVWHWNNILTWTSTTGPRGVTYRVFRGQGSVAYHGDTTTSAAGETIGFRPVLLIPVSIFFENILESNFLCIHDEPVPISGTIKEVNELLFGYKVLVNDTIVIDTSAPLLSGELTISHTLSSSYFMVGLNKIYLLTINEFGETDEISIELIKKCYQSTYIDENCPNQLFSTNTLTLTNSSNKKIFIGFDKFNEIFGYTKTAELELNGLVNGDIKIAPIITSWDQSEVTYNNQPQIDTSKEITVTGTNIFNITDLMKTVEDSFYGIAIYGDTEFSIGVLDNTLSYTYTPTYLELPEVVYGDNVTIRWKPLRLSKPESFLNLILQKSTTADFTELEVIANITDPDITSFRDTTIELGTYYYKMELHFVDNEFQGNQLDFDFVDRSLFIEQNSINGTEFINGTVRLKKTEASIQEVNCSSNEGFIYNSGAIIFENDKLTLKPL